MNCKMFKNITIKYGGRGCVLCTLYIKNQRIVYDSIYDPHIPQLFVFIAHYFTPIQKQRFRTRLNTFLPSFLTFGNFGFLARPSILPSFLPANSSLIDWIKSFTTLCKLEHEINHDTLLLFLPGCMIKHNQINFIL